MTARLALVALVAALTLSCGRRSTAPPTAPPVGPTPPRVEAVFPAARSAGVLYDTAIWVQFDTALDTSSVSERTVFFKADTRRLPATLTWEAATRRLRIVPLDGLGLRRTYTIELAAGLRFTDGRALGEVFAWQFTTNSLRRVQSPLPMDGRVEQSPFIALRWGGLTEATAGPVTYEIHAGPDSATVADPALPGLARVTTPLFVPRVRWRQDGPNYWAIHALNAETGERLVGPAWRFETFPADAAYDSIPVDVVDWNWVESNNTARQRCTEDSIAIGPNVLSTIRWNLAPLDSNLRLAGASIELSPRYATVPATAGASVWSATAPFFGCAHTYPGSPTSDEVNGRLADAVVVSPTRIRFSSDALAAHVEATKRLGGHYGYLFRAPLRRGYFGPGAGTPSIRAVLWLHRYRPPATASLAAGR